MRLLNCKRKLHTWSVGLIVSNSNSRRHKWKSGGVVWMSFINMLKWSWPACSQWIKVPWFSKWKEKAGIYSGLSVEPLNKWLKCIVSSIVSIQSAVLLNTSRFCNEEEKIRENTQIIVEKGEIALAVYLMNSWLMK